MKLYFVDIASCQGITGNWGNNIRIDRISMDTKDEVISFLYNNEINPRDVNLDNSYGIYLQQEKNDSIIGLFSFENNHISTKFSISISEGENRHFSEISYIILDRHLLDITILQKCFSIIIPQLLNSELVNEVVWCEYKGVLWSKIIDSFAKKIEYDYANESHYFAEKIINSNILEVEREKRLRESMKKAGL